ncbi:MAG TPA: EamA family transporter, partial [Planktomarina temperata]|nr:EamA family transporter [Planktomarina temperata]
MTDNIRGIALKVTAVSIFTFMMALIKATSQEVPTGQQVFFRA